MNQIYFMRRGQKTLDDANFAKSSDKIDKYEEHEKKDLKRVHLPRDEIV